ncbi:MAG: PqqD family protein [Candidatus Odinarchaeota archaeon]
MVPKSTGRKETGKDAKETSIPSDDAQLASLYPEPIAGIKEGYWSPSERYLLNDRKDSKAFIIDELGQFVWNLLDGKHSVRDIEKLLVKKAGQQEESIRSSLATFLVNLKNKGYIEFEQR